MSEFTRFPPGDRETLTDPRYNLTLENVASYEAFTDEVATQVVVELRRYFQLNPRTRFYRWRGEVRENGEVETSADSKVHVAVEHADQPRSWPYVIVKSVDGDLPDLWLGQTAGSLVAPNPNFSSFDAAQAKANDEDYDEPELLEVGERLIGKFNCRVELEVGTTGAGAKKEAMVVTDLVLHGLVGPMRRAWYKKALNWQVNSCQLGRAQVSGLQGASDRSLECRRSITFGLQAEWYDDFFYTAEIIDEVLIQRAYLLTR